MKKNKVDFKSDKEAGGGRLMKILVKIVSLAVVLFFSEIVFADVPIKTFKGYDDSVFSVAFNPSGTILASGSYGYISRDSVIEHSVIKLWNVKNGTLIKTLKGHRNYIKSVAFSPDGAVLVSGETDRTIKLWDAKSGILLKTLKGHSKSINSVAFSPNGTMIASGSGDNTINLWDMNPYNESLAKLVYKSIDKSNYIALYEFTQKFSKHFDVVKEARANMYKAVEKEDTLESYSWATNHIGEGYGYLLDKYMKKRYEFIKKLEQAEYKNIDNKNNIFGYKWFINNTKNDIENKQNARKKMYKIIEDKNLLQGYSWFLNYSEDTEEGRKAKIKLLDIVYKKVQDIDTIPAYMWYIETFMKDVRNIEDALENIYKQAYKEAKDKDTIEGYNNFIFNYPLSKQSKEASKKAYELEKEKYTNIGMLSFVGTDEKLNKQARKLLIKVKKYLDKVSNHNISINNIGHYMVISRMYKLLKTEFSDTDAVLTLMETKNLDDFIKKVQFRASMLGNNNENIESEEENVAFYRTVLNPIRYKYNTDDIKKIIEEYFKKDNEAFKKYSFEEQALINPYLKEKEKEALEKKEKRSNEIKNKIHDFENLYAKVVSEYKPKTVKVESLDLDNAKQETGCSKYNLDECVDLGVKYELGKGIKKDYAKARELYKKACDGGNAKGCHNLGGSYLIGEGVQQDYTKAKKLYAKSCNGGYSRGCFMLATLYKKTYNYTKAKELYITAADLGDARGYYNLGVMYEEGKGVGQDYLKASELHQKACDAGWASVCTHLGVFYEFGKGVQQDYTKAKKLYEKACKMKYAGGCEKLKNISRHDTTKASITKNQSINDKKSKTKNSTHTWHNLFKK